MEEGALYMKKTYELEADVSEIVLGISEIIADFYRNEAVLKPGAGRLLKMLQERRIRMVIATTGDKELVETAFARLGILEFFEKIFTCTEIGAGKSSPDIYLEAAAYLKMEPKQILVFEDALHAVQTAKKAGFQVVGIYDESSRKYKQEIQRISDIFLQEADSFEMFLKNISAEAEQQKDAERK